MPKRLRLAFARLTIKLYTGGKVEGEALLDLVDAALLNDRPQRTSPDSAAYTWFEAARASRFRFDPTHSAGYCLFGEGRDYTGIDLEAGHTGTFAYPAPPVRGKAFFVLDTHGNLAVQVSRNYYLQVGALLERLTTRIRALLEMQASVDARLLSLGEALEPALSFISGLSTLTELHFTGIRHSNPEPQSAFLDEAADAEISEIVERSTMGAGIDRKSDIIQGQLGHAEKGYSKIASARGLIEGRKAGVVLGEDMTIIEAEAANDTDEDRVAAVVVALDTMKKLRDPEDRTRAEREALR